MAFLSDLGYAAWQVDQYLAAIRGSYEMKTRVDVLWNDRTHRATLPGVVVDGQVDVKRWRLDKMATTPDPDPDTKVVEDQQMGVTRTARGLTIYDPSYAIAFDAGSPAQGAIYLDRSIQIIVSIGCPFGWFDLPVFTGPVTGFDRDATFVEIEAESNEHFGLGAAFTPFSLSGSTLAAIRTLFDKIGECPTYWDIPNAGDQTMPESVQIGVETRLWDKLFRFAASLQKYAFYDAAGIGRIVDDTDTRQVTFDNGDTGLLLADPKRGHGTADFRNAWRVETSDANGKSVVGKKVVPSTHPLAPTKIGRRGKPLYLLGSENLSGLRTVAKAEERCDKMLALASTDLQLPIVSRPVWHLEPVGVALVKTDEYATSTPIEQFSLPLTPGREMTTGLIRRIPNPQRSSIHIGA